MDRYLLGKEIKRRRVELKLTQKQLSSGICKQSIISKVENGEFFPSFELLIGLSNKLKLSINYLFESAISDQFYYIDQLKNKLSLLIQKHKYTDAFNISDKELRLNEILPGEHKQYIIWARAVSAYQIKKISFNECISIIESCLSEKIDYINQIQKLYIHNSLAGINADAGNYKIALREYEKFLLEFKNEATTTIYVRAFFNYANTLHTCNQFEKALEAVNEALVLCRKIENIQQFGNLYFLKGECLKDLGYTKEEISKCFQKALFYYDLIHQDDYIKILWDTYFDYL